MSDSLWVFLMTCFVIIIMLNIVMFYQKGVFGQDIDPRYYCIENPHYRSCDLQLQKDRQEIMDIVRNALITLADNDSAWYNDSMKRSLNGSQ